ncbi:hypothetical protein GCM10022221_67260 [Actinocorallia aurea]
MSESDPRESGIRVPSSVVMLTAVAALGGAAQRARLLPGTVKDLTAKYEAALRPLLEPVTELDAAAATVFVQQVADRLLQNFGGIGFTATMRGVLLESMRSGLAPLADYRVERERPRPLVARPRMAQRRRRGGRIRRFG